jgi:hypothetical protein
LIDFFCQSPLASFWLEDFHNFLLASGINVHDTASISPISPAAGQTFIISQVKEGPTQKPDTVPVDLSIYRSIS